MRYWPNPAHKLETTEAGPPRWSPDKDPCPRGLTVEERNRLLAASIAENAGDPRSRRFVARRTTAGLELYDIKWSRDVDGDAEFHGHPASRVPRSVLKILQQRNVITAAECRRLARELPGC